MSTSAIPLEELEALARELGPAGMARLRRIQSGSGDYTAERAELLGSPTVAELRAALQQLREKQAQDEGAQGRGS